MAPKAAEFDIAGCPDFQGCSLTVIGARHRFLKTFGPAAVGSIWFNQTCCLGGAELKRKHRSQGLHRFHIFLKLLDLSTIFGAADSRVPRVAVRAGHAYHGRRAAS
jgi:hypothetical protein